MYIHSKSNKNDIENIKTKKRSISKTNKKRIKVKINHDTIAKTLDTIRNMRPEKQPSIKTVVEQHLTRIVELRNDGVTYDTIYKEAFRELGISCETFKLYIRQLKSEHGLSKKRIPEGGKQLKIVIPSEHEARIMDFIGRLNADKNKWILIAGVNESNPRSPDWEIWFNKPAQASTPASITSAVN